ncbi:MAG: hypothetical protein D6695_04100 [Planctomycetota bacterium]|nr:MAG: hypothetical protein D6695_04100 [Planctomycetota bacterium]
MLGSQLDALRSALERRGVRVERLEVETLRSESAGSTPEASRSPEQEAGTNGRDERAAPDRGNAGLAQRASAEADENDRSELEAEPGSVGRQSLNVEWSSTGSVLRLDAIA